MAAAGYADVYYYDESHFGLTPCVPYAWQIKGEGIALPATKGKSITVAGFFNKANQLYTYSSMQPINSQTLVGFFDDFANKTTKKTIVILDNAPGPISMKYELSFTLASYLRLNSRVGKSNMIYFYFFFLPTLLNLM